MNTIFNTQSTIAVRLLIVRALSVVLFVFATYNHAEGEHLRQLMSTDDIRHLVARTGIGASASDIAEHQGLTREQGIELIVQGIRQEPDIPMPAWVESPAPHYHARVEMSDEQRRAFNNRRDAELTQLKQWWVLNMLQTSSPQTERLVLFWHDLFATNARDIGKHPLKMARQNQRFRRLGSGSWETLLKAMIRDAALLAFLDAGANHKTAPNENLARELMELFVLGEGHYDEITVKNAARALTGHNVALLHNLAFQRNSGSQDRDIKQLFNQSGKFDGDDLIEILLEQEAAPEFLASRFWYAFVADSKPPQRWLADQAGRFRESGFDISTLYRNVLQSTQFWDEPHRGAIIKSPVDLIVGTARTLDYPMRYWQQMPDWQATIGMNLFEPPNVAGWKEGAAFVTPGHLLNRYNIIEQMTGESPPPDVSMSPDMNNNAMMENTSQMYQSNTQQDIKEPLLVNKAASQTRQRAVPDKPVVASGIHTHKAITDGNKGVSRIDILLDHVDTGEKQFDNIRFSIEKKPQSPLMLKLGSFSCWPDCIDVWPKECGWTDKHFAQRRTLSFPWIAKDDERWLSSTAYQCQFTSLSIAEKTLISTLWSNLPELLASIKQTKRFAQNKEAWLPAMAFIESQYSHPSIEADNTPYVQFAQSIKIGEDYAPAVPDVELFSPPKSTVNGIDSLMSALSTQELHLHQLLLPDIGQALMEKTPLHTSALTDGASSDGDGYLQAVLNHPLFQLK